MRWCCCCRCAAAAYTHNGSHLWLPAGVSPAHRQQDRGYREPGCHAGAHPTDSSSLQQTAAATRQPSLQCWDCPGPGAAAGAARTVCAWAQRALRAHTPSSMTRLLTCETTKLSPPLCGLVQNPAHPKDTRTAAPCCCLCPLAFCDTLLTHRTSLTV